MLKELGERVLTTVKQAKKDQDIEKPIDWLDPSAKISEFFTVKEALWLPSWGRMANPTDDGLTPEHKDNLVKLFQTMDKVRRLFDKPIIVHVAYRPPIYNQMIGGSPGSAHKFGMAVDFHVSGIKCDTVREVLVDKLEEFGLRMENLPGSNWVHLDIRPVAEGKNRYFLP